ncbi:MAG: hypothetical protein ACWGOD_01990 [Desulfobulbales bacterium]
MAFFLQISNWLLQRLKRVEYQRCMNESDADKENYSMQSKIISFLLSLVFLTVCGFNARATDNNPTCIRLDEKASGEMTRYSLDAEVDGPLYFNDIGCGIRYRNKELCAMEMVRFDNSAKVYDYYTSKEIAIGKAFFWLDQKNQAGSVLAFSSKDAAEKYGTEKGNGIILDYTDLSNKLLK